jgi:NitT/TauT family transport system substrate-binding protein
VLRVGFFANLTHTAALCGLQSGRFARAVGGVRVEPCLFSAGPAAMEALLSGSLDLAYVGPTPLLIAWNASRRRAVKLLAGACSGGASLVVGAHSTIGSARDLSGRSIATAQYGNTQDLAARRYIARAGLSPVDHGGTVNLLHLSNADILTQFRLHRLEAAWVAEPWVSRLIAETGARLLLDERSLWPNGRFASTLLVTRKKYLAAAPTAVASFVQAHRETVRWIVAEPEQAQRLVQRALARYAGRPLSATALAGAWSRTDFTDDVLADTLRAQAQNARELGFLPTDDISELL